MNIYKITYSQYVNDVHTQYIVAESIDVMLDMFERKYISTIDNIEVVAKDVYVQEK